jgi:hypothetical protein
MKFRAGLQDRRALPGVSVGPASCDSLGVTLA